MSRNEEAKDACANRHNGFAILALQGIVNPVNKSEDTQTNPDTERIERTGIGVVPFARLIRCLVEVHDDCKTR